MSTRRAKPEVNRIDRRRGRLGCAAGVFAMLLLLPGLGWADAHEGGGKPADKPAKEGRPSEVPYDTPGEVPLLSPDYRQANHKVVLITDDSVSPQTVKLKEGQLVAWISYSQNSAVVVFEREVARSMICHSLVNFSIQDDELRSAPIRPGEFASFCELKPGRYGYKIIRPGQREEGHTQSRTRLRGEIIVGDI